MASGAFSGVIGPPKPPRVFTGLGDGFAHSVIDFTHEAGPRTGVGERACAFGVQVLNWTAVSFSHILSATDALRIALYSWSRPCKGWTTCRSRPHAPQPQSRSSAWRRSFQRPAPST